MISSAEQSEIERFLEREGKPGLLIDLTEFDLSLKIILLEVQRNANNYIDMVSQNFSRPAKLVFAFQNSGAFRLSALRISDNLYCILMSYGLPLLLSDLLLQILEGSRSQPSWLSAAEEISDFSETKSIRQLHCHWSDLCQERGKVSLTVKFEHYALLTLLRAYMLETLVIHEGCHVVHGHLSKFTEGLYIEFSEQTLHKESPSLLERQALELDADMVAANRVFDFALMSQDSDSKYPEVWRELQQTKSDLVYFWAYATYLLMRFSSHCDHVSLEDEVGSLKQGKPLKNHPPTAIRMRLLEGSAIAKAVQRNHGHLAWTMPNIISSAKLHVDSALEIFFGIHTNLKGIHGFEFGSVDKFPTEFVDYCVPYLAMLHETQHAMSPELNEAALIPMGRTGIEVPENFSVNDA